MKKIIFTQPDNSGVKLQDRLENNGFELIYVDPNWLFITWFDKGAKVLIQNGAKDNNRKKIETNTAFLTFVAVDQGGRPIDVPQVIPETDFEKELFCFNGSSNDEGESRADGPNPKSSFGTAPGVFALDVVKSSKSNASCFFQNLSLSKTLII